MPTPDVSSGVDVLDEIDPVHVVVEENFARYKTGSTPRQAMYDMSEWIRKTDLM
jgi:hypothetical protein